MITSVLTEAGEPGKPALALAKDIGYVGTTDSRRDQLSRDIRALRTAGIEISNVSDLGEEGRWVLRPQDSRVRLAFADAQRAELARAALLAGGTSRERLLAQMGSGSALQEKPPLAVQDPNSPHELDPLLHAVTAHCVVAFTYSGKARRVDPHRIEYGTSGWWLRGREHAADREKTYTVSRMSEVTVSDPGSAKSRARAEQPSADPLTWLVDEPVEAAVSCESQYETDVRSFLNARDSVATQAELPNQIVLTVAVTNRQLFLARVIELGARVRMDGPTELRNELRDRLKAVIQ
jgi:predicted DNA-binding transcriptional regulator YafY